MNLFARLGFVLLLLFAVQGVRAQDILKGSDLSKISVDALTDEDIAKYREQLKTSGLTESQVEQLALQRGMPQQELAKLKLRLAKLETISRYYTNTPLQSRTRTVDTTSAAGSRPTIPDATAELPSKVFGSELFANTTMTFEPNTRIATPKNYMVGPDDELLVDVFGYQEVNYRLTVSPEGSITIPYVGAIPVAGSSVEQVTKRIRDRMTRNGYASLGSGQSQLVVSIGRIKSIKVTIIGEAKRPGTYTLSSLSSMFNALYAAGGIAERGSFRTIELIRNNGVVRRLDAYDFLLRGDLSNNAGLVDQDVIRIPVASLQVEVMGEVKRPGIFEMLPTENMNDLIRFSGGFTNEAYTAALHVRQLNERERQLKDITRNEFSTYQPQRGDVVIVDRILETYTNRVAINGAVLRPGEFELTPGLMLSQLIKKADGLRKDAFNSRALLVRTRENLTTEVIPFQVDEVLNNPAYDIRLQKEDEVTIASIFDYKTNYKVTIQGEVRRPGEFTYVENLTLKDLLFQAGGFTDAAVPQQIEIARRIDNDTLNANQRIAEVIDVQSARDLEVRGSTIRLSPWDIVMVRTNPGYKPQVMVQLQGEVAFPGAYALATNQDRISDVLKRAGGLTQQAYMQGAYLVRVNKTGIAREANLSRIQKIQDAVKDSSNTLLNDATNPTIRLGLNLEKIMAAPQTSEDIVLQEGDVLNVSKKTNEVTINGEVMFPTQVVYKEGANFNYYIDKAGGFTDNARKKRTYVLYANGNAGKSSRFLFFKNYPDIKPGAEILVPRVADRNRQRLTTGEVIGLTTAFATLLTIIVTLTRL